MSAGRICVECKAPLSRQRFWHRRLSKTGSRLCWGPKKTPGGGRVRAIGGLPIHLSLYVHSLTTCGMVPGRGGKYPWPRDGKFDVAMGRVTVKFEHVTCEECLVTVADEAAVRARRRLAVTKRNIVEVRETAMARRTMHSLGQLVGA